MISPLGSLLYDRTCYILRPPRVGSSPRSLGLTVWSLFLLGILAPSVLAVGRHPRNHCPESLVSS